MLCSPHQKFFISSEANLEVQALENRAATATAAAVLAGAPMTGSEPGKMQPLQPVAVDEAAPAQPEAASTTASASHAARKPSVTVTDEGGTTTTNGGSLGALDGEHEPGTPVTPFEHLSQDLNLLPSKGDALIHLLRLSARLMVCTRQEYFYSSESAQARPSDRAVCPPSSGRFPHGRHSPSPFTIPTLVGRGAAAHPFRSINHLEAGRYLTNHREYERP